MWLNSQVAQRDGVSLAHLACTVTSCLVEGSAVLYGSN